MAIEDLEPSSYTAHRLKHASPEHLHLTSRRFFIGPIPEGWLNSNRKSWYKRRVELSSYSSRAASFTAASANVHRRTLTGLEDLSTAARIGFSFPQPQDIEDDGEIDGSTQRNDDEDSEDADVMPSEIAPVATHEDGDGGALANIEQEEPAQAGAAVQPQETHLRPQLGNSKEPARSLGHETFHTAREERPQDTFYTAREGDLQSSRQATPPRENDVGPPCMDDGQSRRQSGATQPTPLDSNPSDFYGNGNSNGEISPPAEAENSRTALLPIQAGVVSPKSAKTKVSLREEHPDPEQDLEDSVAGNAIHRTTTGVRFKIAEGVADGQARVARRIDTARDKLVNKQFRRNTLREGSIVKAEKMLVRVDTTMLEVPSDFDENESQKIETRVIEKWREFMVVARRSNNEDRDDFRLQMYKTRVIPEIENEKTTKKPTREIKLIPKVTKVNLFSSLDKTVVIWHPYKKGTRIFIMRPRSSAHSVEWYTFLRDSLGWHRPSTLQVNVPDFDVTLRLERPFEDLEAVAANDDDDTVLAKTAAAEQAVAGKIIRQCLDMLEGDPEWSDVLQTWSSTVHMKMGLAWRRYDRLEWIHGANEQKMYGSMAMAHSHDLELRPKQHYPTVTYGKKGMAHDEPAPVEGFLIRLTSQKGIHQRSGKAFFKRLYFHTQNQFLVFNRPAKSTPPHPPRLATISGTNVPSSIEIIDKTPTMYEIDPFPIQNNDIPWLSGSRESMSWKDGQALEESRRNIINLESCDGYINLVHVVKVRKMQWGATPADDNIDSGSDVDFHQEIENTRREDGTTTELDDNRTFELLLRNGLVVRLQAYSEETMREWMKRLKALVKYWKLRTAADVDLFKAVRKDNLATLQIDEEMEAIVGQFARKWEVSRSEASPQLYHMCGISRCRSINISGLLYRKARRRATFQRCGVILAAGQLHVFQATLRTRSGAQVRHIHQQKQTVMDLKDCYVYSGLITEDDLLYQNQTFDSNHPGTRALPRVYLEDGWTSCDEDTMTCFVVWHGVRKSYFKAIVGEGKDGGTRQKLRQVSALGVPGRSVVFKARSRAERDHWVMSLGVEIDRLQEAMDVELRVEVAK